MTIDHIGFLWYSELGHPEIWRTIGRLSFPLFCWGVVRGYRLSRNRWKYARRLLILAGISQIPFVLSFYGGNIWWGMNVCFTLLAGLSCIAIWEEKNFLTEIRPKRKRDRVEYIVKILAIGMIAMLAGDWKVAWVSYGLNFDYGMYGVLVILLLHIFWQKPVASLVSFSVITGILYYTNIPLLWTHIMSGNIAHIPNAFWLLSGKIDQWWSIFALVILYLPILQKYDFRFPVWLRYGFYPGHMMILYSLTFVIP